MRWSFHLGRIAGIEVRVHATFLLLLAWIGLADLAAHQDPLIALVDLAFLLAVFGVVVLHETGHAVVARRYGVRTRDITLLPIGGVARLENMPEAPRAELAIAIAGPAVNALIALVLAGALVAAGASARLAPGAALGASFVPRLLWANVSLALFNLLPAFPMDGGRVLRALLAMRVGRPRATEIAARLMGEARLHHLVAVDAAGNAVGMLSSLDVVCALLGLPATHPPMFPHYDTSTGLTWTDDTPLAADRVEVAPDGVGILVLVTGGAGRRELPVWAEASRNVRTRLLDLLTTPQRDRPMLARLLEREHLRFRAASARSFSEAASLAERLRTEALGSLPTPRT
jgi:Zn-dependent protease